MLRRRPGNNISFDVEDDELELFSTGYGSPKENPTHSTLTTMRDPKPQQIFQH